MDTWQGDVLYIPRAFFHHTATEPAMLDAEDFNGLSRGDAAAAADDDDESALEGEPSMALTVSILNEDVYNSWLYALGEAVQEAAVVPIEVSAAAAAAEQAAVAVAGARRKQEAEAVVRSIRRAAARTAAAGESDIGARLREGLPRVVALRCGLSEQPLFTASGEGAWRKYARQLAADAVAVDQRASSALPEWLFSLAADAPLFVALDAVLARKRIPCSQKLDQIEAMQSALVGKLPLTGEPLTPGIDVDAIFMIEKKDKSYLPRDKSWFRPGEWAK